jgi:hypothetical protein
VKLQYDSADALLTASYNLEDSAIDKGIFYVEHLRSWSKRRNAKGKTCPHSHACLELVGVIGRAKGCAERPYFRVVIKRRFIIT